MAGIHPALMEHLATGRMSVAQIAQRILHRAGDTHDPKRVHDFALVKRLLQGEAEDILTRLRAAANLGDARGRAAFDEAEARYRKALKIGLRWIRNDTELDFRSLGSSTRADLEAIAAAPDAF